jgi:uncharacterized repeat protein (TIGR03803 family)
LVYAFNGLTNCDLASPTNKTCDGFGPVGGMIIVGTRLYGTTSGGGTHDSGTLFSIPLANYNGYEVEHEFGMSPKNGGIDGASPQAPLTLVRGATLADDIIYGTTYAGGDAQLGTVFSYQPSTNAYKVLHSFLGAYPPKGMKPDGAMPLGPVTYFNGYLYGTTTIGGRPKGGPGCFDNDGCGTVYSINLATGEETVLHDFEGSFPTDAKVLPDGSNPQGGLTVLDGVLYGTTSGGGGFGCFAAEGCGTVFQIGPQGGTSYTVLHRFCSTVGPVPNPPGQDNFCTDDGAYPSGNLTRPKPASMLLYGGTAQGGVGDCLDGCGTIFNITPASAKGGAATVQTVFGISSASGAHFDSNSGVGPEGNLISADYSHRGIPDYSHRGSFFGAAIAGGSGIVNSVDTIDLDAALSSSTCKTPNLPGAAGTVYLVQTPTNTQAPTITALFNFSGKPKKEKLFNGAQPDGNLVPYTTPGGQYQLYGTTYAGGNCQSGTVFVIDNIDDAAAALPGP